MPKYTVKDSLNHDQKDYAIGKTVEMTEEAAEALLAVGVIELPAVKAAKEPVA
jgi:hypothetical protein